MAMPSSKLLLLLSIAVLLLVHVQATAGRTPRHGRRPSLQAQFLTPHNSVRASVGLKPLAWDARLAQYAESYASQRRRDCVLEHSGGPYGENIFWDSDRGWRPAQAVSAWVAERRWYRYGTNSCAGGECGHYTQVVWSDNRRLGCAMVNCLYLDMHIVC